MIDQRHLTTVGKTLVRLAVLALALTPAVCLAGAGDLDLTFGDGGKVTTNFLGPNEDYGRDAVAVQADGKIVVVGESRGISSFDFAVARYNSDGTLDNAFGTDGTVTTDFASSDNRPSSVAIQTDGKIVVVGYTYGSPTGTDFALARYNSDGTLDIGFGTDGKMTTDFASGNDVAKAVAIQADGKIVVAGAANSGPYTHEKFAIARYNSDGTLDTGFDDDGKVITDFGSNGDVIHSLVIQADGKIVVAGYSYGGSSTRNDYALARYNSDGTLDTGFGGDGKVATDFNSANDFAYAATLQADGKIVVAGYSNSGYPNWDYNFTLARYNSDGTLDTGFDGDGKITTDFGSSYYELGYDVAIQADGRIVVAGSFFSGGPTYGDFAIACYNSDGTLDAGFDGDGKVITDFGSYYDYCYAVAIQADGKIVAAGSTGHYSSKNNFALARYNDDGTLDAGFGEGGKVITDFMGPNHDFGRDVVAVQADGKIVVAGYSSGPPTYTYEFALARFNSDGTLDTGFGIDGKVTTGFPSGDDYAQGIAIQPDGKIVVAGYTHNRYSYRDDFALVRYNSDGTLDTGFGGDGKVTSDFPSNSNQAYAVAIQTDGKIVVAGYRYSSGSTRYDFALVRYNPDGTLDANFGSGGLVTTDFASGYDYANAVTIQADGKILAAGPAGSDGATGTDFGLARYNRNGTLDANFGSGGLVTTDFASGYDAAYAVAIQADGKIVVAGQTQYSGSPTGADFALARYEGISNSPLELLALLVGEIQKLVTIGDLNNGQGNALLVKLQAAIQQMDRDNTGAAINQLQAFVNQLEALMNAGILSPEEGQSLIAAAQAALDGLAKPGGDLASEEGTPSRYQLFQNYPNPFNAQTTIEYALTEAADVTVDVYNLLGRRVAVLIDEHKQAGHHSVNWDAATVASGTYFYRIQAGENVETRKMLLLK